MLKHCVSRLMSLSRKECIDLTEERPHCRRPPRSLEDVSRRNSNVNKLTFVPTITVTFVTPHLMRIYLLCSYAFNSFLFSYLLLPIAILVTWNIQQRQTYSWIFRTQLAIRRKSQTWIMQEVFCAKSATFTVTYVKKNHSTLCCYWVNHST